VNGPALDARLRAVCDLMLPRVRESAGLHAYDGQVPDLSPDAVRAKVAALGGGPARGDAHEEAHLGAFEAMLRVTYGEAQLHRRSARPLLEALDLAGYDRDYAPLGERLAARRRHLAAWPDAIDAGLAALDAMPSAVAEGLLGSVRGLAATLDPDEPLEAAALAAHRRRGGGPGPAPAARAGGAARAGPRRPPPPPSRAG
jgi:hypothetical protein